MTRPLPWPERYPLLPGHQPVPYVHPLVRTEWLQCWTTSRRVLLRQHVPKVTALTSASMTALSLFLIHKKMCFLLAPLQLWRLLLGLRGRLRSCDSRGNDSLSPNCRAQALSASCHERSQGANVSGPILDPPSGTPTGPLSCVGSGCVGASPQSTNSNICYCDSL